MLPLATLTACATLETPRTADSFCLIAARMTYSVLPRVERDAAEAEKRAVRDDGNKADTPETVAQIGEHNARWRSICQPPADHPDG